LSEALHTPVFRTLGVLGGMGPAATVDFLTKLQAATPANADADHIRVLMDLNPRTPDRHTMGWRPAKPWPK
jgi:aspartate racemase